MPCEGLRPKSAISKPLLLIDIFAFAGNTLSSPLLGRRKESLNSLFAQFHREIFQQTPKNVAVLQMAAKICRAMEGKLLIAYRKGSI